MRVIETELPGVLIIEPVVFQDPRGYFMETWQVDRYQTAGLPGHFAQDNISFSTKGVLRGLHFQNPHPQAKLVQTLTGEIFDVAVDIRRGSPTFGRWIGVALSADRPRQLFIPEGYAHGFVVISETALVTYKCTAPYKQSCERSIHWADPDIGIHWPIHEPLLSAKDAGAPGLKEIETHLPWFLQ